MKYFLLSAGLILSAGAASASCYNYAESGGMLPAVNVCFAEMDGGEGCEMDAVVVECENVNSKIVEFVSGLSLTRDLTKEGKDSVTFSQDGEEWQLGEGHLAWCESLSDDGLSACNGFADLD
ncbi:hypothetical protein [Donghicola mangrovi]|uniref:Cyanovirin-N domain-containing protein n=1 Tax=Donghicola mangrovi TaxID=2729614 RepID=A0A850QAH6_9RHOB|nr:hypothetical protein [Donghicola mangrovi]NVO23289.1 hypothetical protein [Donghicola mangrovi]